MFFFLIVLHHGVPPLGRLRGLSRSQAQRLGTQSLNVNRGVSRAALAAKKKPRHVAIPGLNVDSKGRAMRSNG